MGAVRIPASRVGGRQWRTIPGPVALAVIAVTACGSAPGAAGPTPGGSSSVSTAARLDPAAFARAIADPARVTVNVHVPYEGQLDGTDVAIPYDTIGPGAAGLPADRRTPLAVYCRTGRMSAIAVARLAAMGYTDVVELTGGMVAWESAGLPIRN